MRTSNKAALVQLFIALISLVNEARCIAHGDVHVPPAAKLAAILLLHVLNA